MSNIVASMVWQLKREAMASNPKMLMVSLADQSNDDGLTVYLRGGIPALAQRCAFSDRTCQRLLAFLIKDKWISVVARETHHTPRTYQLNLSKLKSHKFRGDNLSSLNSSRGDNLSSLPAIRGDNHDISGVTTTTFRGDNGDTHSFTCINHDKNMEGINTHGSISSERNGSLPLSLSASPLQKKENTVYQKLAQACGIQLPPTKREREYLTTAMADLRGKMEADLFAEGIHDLAKLNMPKMACEAIENLLRFWRTQDWRGKKGESPSPAQLVESYGNAKTWTGN